MMFDQKSLHKWFAQTLKNDADVILFIKQYV